MGTLGRTAVSLAVRVLVGTLLFMLVLALVEARDAHVAGMMLTFPALNGIGLLMTATPDKRAMVRAMLPVIALNGALAIGYAEMFRALSARLPGAERPLAWLMLLAGVGIWIAACFWLSRARPRVQQRLVIGFLVWGVLFTIGAWSICIHPSNALSAGWTAPSWLRIALFALILAIVLLIAEVLASAHALLGRLSAFPLLPLFSLASVAEGRTGAQRLAELEPTIPLGIMLAMAFAWIYAAGLEGMHARIHTAASRLIAGMAGLLSSWAATIGIIFGAAAMIRWLTAC